MRSMDDNILNVYILKVNPDQTVTFLVDDLYPDDPQGSAKIGEISTAPDKMDILLALSGPTTSKQPYTTKYGSFMTAYAPIDDAVQGSTGNTYAVLAIDVSAADVGPDKRVTYDDMTRNAQRALRLFPPLQNLNVVRLWAGLRPFTVDGLPILGSVGSLKGVLLATGHSGITLAQVTGKVITELVTTGGSSTPLDEFTLERFTSVRYKFAMDAFQRAHTQTGSAA